MSPGDSRKMALFADVKSLEDVDNVDALDITSRDACSGSGSEDGEVLGLHVCELVLGVLGVE